MRSPERRDLSKLPKWARQEIERLRKDLDYAHALLSTGREGSRVFAEPYSDHPRPLGKDVDVEFRLDDGMRFKVSIEDDALEIYGGDQVSVHPRSSNVVLVRATRF